MGRDIGFKVLAAVGAFCIGIIISKEFFTNALKIPYEPYRPSEIRKEAVEAAHAGLPPQANPYQFNHPFEATQWQHAYNKAVIEGKAERNEIAKQPMGW